MLGTTKTDVSMAWDPMAWDHGNHIPQGHQKPLWKLIKKLDNLNIFIQITIGPFCTPAKPGFRSHGPKHYTTSDWLGPGNGFENVMKGANDEM